MNNLRAIFAGTPEFALPSLQCLVESDVEVIAVLTQPDRPKGRGRKLTAPPVKLFCEDKGIRVLQTHRITRELIEELQKLSPDVMVVVAFGLLLPAELLQLPKYGCINVHASLLPKWRGAAPVARAIEAGDGKTGVTIMHMDVGLDTGPMLSQLECAIQSDDTTDTLQQKLAVLGAQELLKTLNTLPQKLKESSPQLDSQASYASKLTVAESFIDWNLSADEIVRKVRAYNPWPIAKTIYQGMGIRIWAAQVFSYSGMATPGEVIECSSGGVIVGAGHDAVKILCLQRDGKKRMRVQEFLSGLPISPGSIFGHGSKVD